MSSIAKTNISLNKKDLQKSRIPPVASRNVVFYHKATAGQLTISLLSLTFPSSEMPTAVQATADELSGAKLSINKKNLDLVSSSKGQLIQNLDYVVVDSNTIALIGDVFASGTESEEIFVGTINSAPVSDLIVASAKSVVKTYSLPVGQTILNVAHEFMVNQFPSESVGIIKVFVNGILALRNTGNSSTILDRDYYEVDSGNGFGTVICFSQAPVGTPNEVVIDFGIQSITDFNAIGTIESLSGSIKKLADDVAVIAGTSPNDYINANPSDIERRGFGDMVLDHESRVDILETALPLKADLNGNAAQLFNVADSILPNNAVALGQFESSLTTNGYQKLPGGLIMQWGTVGVGVAVVFPIPFPNQALNVIISVNNSDTGAYAPSHSFITSLTTTGFTRFTQTLSARWFAIGY
jgi:hypothetical protein